MKMSPHELEYAISQYLDGTLPPPQRAALDERLAVDPEARRMLEEYGRLDALIRSAAVPTIAWDRLAEQIRDAIAKEQVPLRHYSLRPMRLVGGLAIAASIMLAIGIALHFAAPPAKPIGVAKVSGPAAETAAGPVVAQIGIGPAPTATAALQPADQIISRPTVVLIDQARPSAQDSESGLY